VGSLPDGVEQRLLGSTPLLGFETAGAETAPGWRR